MITFQMFHQFPFLWSSILQRALHYYRIISDLGYPTELRGFLKSCAADYGEEIDPDNYTKVMQLKVEAVLSRICNDIPASSQFKSCIDAQGCFQY